MGRPPLKGAPRFYLDTNAVIAILERTEGLNPAQRMFLLGIADGRWFAASSELTLAECIVKPIRDGAPEHRRSYEEFLDTQLSAPLLPVSREILVLASEIRAVSKAKMPDCIHVASALALNCDVMVSADTSLPLPRSIRRVAFSAIDLEIMGM